MKTIVLGLGNILYGDDGAGVLTARALKADLTAEGVAVEEGCLSGLDALEVLGGFDEAIVVDAVQTPGGKPGTIYRLEEANVLGTQSNSAHEMDFLAALRLGRALAMDLPRQVVILAIEAGSLAAPAARCSPEVEAAIPLCCVLVRNEVRVGSASVHVQ